MCKTRRKIKKNSNKFNQQSSYKSKNKFQILDLILEVKGRSFRKEIELVPVSTTRAVLKIFKEIK